MYYNKIFQLILFFLATNSQAMQKAKIEDLVDAGAGIGLPFHSPRASVKPQETPKIAPASSAATTSAAAEQFEHKREVATAKEEDGALDTSSIREAFGFTEEEAASFLASDKFEVETESVVGPSADSEPLGQALCESILKGCSPRITALIAMWNQKDVGGSPIVFATQQLRENYYKKIHKKLLLMGPAGTGKSSMGKAIATRCSIPFFMYGAPLCSTKYKNSGSENLEKIFKEAAALKEPCMIIIDEIATIFKQHNNSVDTENGALTALWVLMDKYKNHPILFVVTLNDIEGAPAPIMDRFKGHTVKMDLPDQSSRAKLLEYYLRELCDDISGVSCVELAKKTSGFSHRQLMTLAHIAAEKEWRTGIGTAKITQANCLWAFNEMVKEGKILTGGTWWTKRYKNINKWGPSAVKGFLGFAAVAGVGYYLNHRINLSNQLFQQKLVNDQVAREAARMADEKSFWNQVFIGFKSGMQKYL